MGSENTKMSEDQTAPEVPKMNPTDTNNLDNATEKLEAMQSELHCGICHDYFVQAYTLSCSHSFCFNCIDAWQRNHSDCPVCRRHILGMAPSRALDNMVAALNGGANANPPQNERQGAWFSSNTQPVNTTVSESDSESEDGTDPQWDEEDEYSEEGSVEGEEEHEEYEEHEENYVAVEEEEEGEEDNCEEEDYQESSYSDSDDDDAFFEDGNYSFDSDYDHEAEDYHEHVLRSNMNNPNNNEYWKARGWSGRPDNWKELYKRH